MINAIPLTEKREASQPIKFFISGTVCKNAKLTSLGAANLAAKLSASPSLYIHRYSYTNADGFTDFRYDVFSAGGVFTCVKKKEFGNYSVVFFSNEDFHKKRQAINKGISFAFDKKILVTVQYGSDFWNYEGGKKVNAPSTKNCADIFTYIDEQFDAGNSATKPTAEISEELAKLLKCAEAYSETDYALEENDALIDGKLFYERVSASENSKDDNINYLFRCSISEQQDKKRLVKKWKAGKVVQITLKDQTNISAPIYRANFESNQPVLELIFTKQTDFNAIPEAGFIQIPLNNTVKNTQAKAFNQIRERNVPAPFLEDVLGEGKCKPHKTENLQALIRSFENRKYPLNKSQRIAIEEALTAQDLYLVMGPPGTGKTTVIVEWVKYLVGEKKAKVLIASQNNSAVDNVLKKLKDEPCVDMLRISGNQQKVDDDVIDAYYGNKVQKTRQKISQQVAANQQGLAQLQTKWEEIEASFDVIASFYEKYRQSKQEAEENVKTAAGLYKKARASYGTIAQQAMKLRKKYENLNLLDRIYRAYYHYEPIREIFFYIGTFLRYILKHKAKHLSKKYTELQASIKDYNNSIETYNSLIQETQTVLYEKMHTYNEVFQEKICGINIRAVANDAYGIFPIKQEMLENLSDIDRFHSVFEILTAGKEKLYSARGVLEKWNEHINNTQNYAIESILLQGANVVGATCVGISSNPYAADLDFDVVIIDEAGQIQIHNCLIPLRLGKKAIMLGDHKQLPPVARQEALQILESMEIDWSLYTKSLFEYLYDKLPQSNKTMLDTQYRMPKVVADVLSEAFYEGKYHTHESKEQVSSGIGMFDNKPFVVIDTSDSNRRREEEKTHVNEYEAEICEKIFAKLTEDMGQKDKNVAVIAGLTDQVELIAEKIAKKHGKDVARHVVHTVDSYQGRECDTVIFSFTRSSDRSEEEVRVGFLSELRRLNVAMSRCMRCLILVGDMEFLTRCKNVTGFQGTAEKGITGTEEKFSQFLREILSVAEIKDAIRMSSEQLYKKLEES